MDPITRLEDSLDTLLKVMASAIAYLSRKAGHKQVNPRVPLTVLGTTEALPEDELRANRDELVHDLVAQAKEVEQHIAALPVLDTDESARVRHEIHPRPRVSRRSRASYAPRMTSTAQRCRKHVRRALTQTRCSPSSTACSRACAPSARTPAPCSTPRRASHVAPTSETADFGAPQWRHLP